MLTADVGVSTVKANKTFSKHSKLFFSFLHFANWGYYILKSKEVLFFFFNDPFNSFK